MCHDPHAEDNRLLLHEGGGGDLCGSCHFPIAEAMRTVDRRHGDLDGECLRCHEAHASDWPGLLDEDSGEQCLRCHDDVYETIETSEVTHRGAMTDRQCVTCHDPHAAVGPAMLRADEAVVCLSCHDTPLKAVDGRTIGDMTEALKEDGCRHGPVDHGRCELCHSVHGSEFSMLLRGSNPEQILGSFDLRHYGLCFSCHDERLVTETETTAVTAFRNGTENLHALHVRNGGKGRSCSTCHVVHGGHRPRLMADDAVYEGSQWKMPLGFELTARGGRCAPGCHEPLSYDRGPGGRD